MNKFVRYLTQGFVGGLLNPKGNMANWQHATRLFVDDNYRLAPRTKFMFYAQFELDRTAVKSNVFTEKHSNEIGFLIKGTDLPKFTIDTVTKNQYNRKKLVYKNITYDPISMTFHDDNAGIINALWAIYYGYYFQDRALPDAAFSDTKYRPQYGPLDTFRYGLDNDKSVDIFKSISIYTLSRKRFNGYTLINPRIQNWAHGSVAYGDNDVLESTMTVQYESVRYSSGNVSVNNPKGFATLHYDVSPSPLSVAGGGVARLTGTGGVLDGISQVFGAVGSGSAFGSVGGFLGTAIAAANTYNNAGRLSKEGLKNEAINILSSPSNIRGAVNTVSGVIGSAFPSNTQGSGGTTATQKNLTNNNPSAGTTI
jgi:hypothetical protein